MIHQEELTEQGLAFLQAGQTSESKGGSSFVRADIVLCAQVMKLHSAELNKI